MSFEKELTRILNCGCAENASNTPDFILAEFMLKCLAAFNSGVNRREDWYGRGRQPGDPAPKRAEPISEPVSEPESGPAPEPLLPPTMANPNPIVHLRVSQPGFPQCVASPIFCTDGIEERNVLRLLEAIIELQPKDCGRMIRVTLDVIGPNGEKLDNKLRNKFQILFEPGRSPMPDPPPMREP